MIRMHLYLPDFDASKCAESVFKNVTTALYELVCAKAGGCTAVEGRGYWREPVDGQLVVENVIVLDVVLPGVFDITKLGAWSHIQHYYGEWLWSTGQQEGLLVVDGVAFRWTRAGSSICGPKWELKEVMH